MNTQDFLAADDTDYASVEVAGYTIHLGSLSAGDLYDYFEEIAQAKGTPDRRFAGIKLLNKSLVSAPDAGGSRVGTEETLAGFKKKNPKNVAKLVAEVLKLNGIETDKEAAKEAEKAVKND
jgi:hypothetical protein